jgi:hypothetical protein
MLEYNKIKFEVEKRNFNLKYFIPKYTDMKPDGFRLACENGTLKVRTLQAISNTLKVPMSFWFLEEDKALMAEGEIQYGETFPEIIKRLNALLEESMDDKRRMKREIDQLKEKMGLP